ENYIASSWRCSTTAKARGPRSLPASSRSPSGTKLLPIPRWPTPSWIGWSTMPTGSNSKANRCAKAKCLLRKMKTKNPQSQARLFGRAGESVTRSDRRQPELEFGNLLPPLTARPNRRRDDALGWTVQASPLEGAPKEREIGGELLTPVRQDWNGVRYALEQVSAFIGIRIRPISRILLRRRPPRAASRSYRTGQ